MRTNCFCPAPSIHPNTSPLWLRFYSPECTPSVINSSTFSMIIITKTTITDLPSVLIIISLVVVIIQSEGELKGDERNRYILMNRKYLTGSLMSADIRPYSWGGGGGAEARPPPAAFELIDGIIRAWWRWLEERGPPCNLQNQEGQDDSLARKVLVDPL